MEKGKALPKDPWYRKYYWDMRKVAWQCARCSVCKWVDTWQIRQLGLGRRRVVWKWMWGGRGGFYLTNRAEAVKGNCVKRGCPYGNVKWIETITQKLGLEITLRPRGRPEKGS